MATNSARRASYAGLDYAVIVCGERANSHFGIVDHGSLKPHGTAERPLVVGRCLDAAAALPGNGVGDHEVDWDPARAEP